MKAIDSTWTPALLLALGMALAGPACGSDDDGGGSPDAAAGEPDAAASAADAAVRATPAPFDPSTPYQPDVDPADLSADITNPLFPAPVGATWSYSAETPDGLETTEISVEPATVDVNGVAARELRDTVFLDGEIIEDTRDWFAQDGAGNVWYLGEDTAEYEGGVIVSTEGSWQWGVDDALPGVNMLGDPQIGDLYRQEYLAGEAEDYGEVVSLDEAVTVPAGSFTGCTVTRDRSAIEPAADELKYYCAGVGTVLTEEGDVRDELIDYAVP
ncbi:MAG TPA: hypothetical protein VK698_00885 [Kofleriaceae bacterium]|nr:hypothetical protein [Kofleriaceae bacterium]